MPSRTLRMAFFFYTFHLLSFSLVVQVERSDGAALTRTSLFKTYLTESALIFLYILTQGCKQTLRMLRSHYDARYHLSLWHGWHHRHEIDYKLCARMGYGSKIGCIIVRFTVRIVCKVTIFSFILIVSSFISMSACIIID